VAKKQGAQFRQDMAEELRKVQQQQQQVKK
jgi:hypothetical protein